MNPYQPGEDNQDPYEVGYKAGAASRDAEIAYLLEANRIACEDLVEQQNLRVKYAGQIEELAAALEQLTTYDCRPSNIWKFFYPSSTGDYVNLIEFREKLAAALAKVRKP